LNVQNELCGTNINSVKEEKIFPACMDGLDHGISVYRNFDHAFVKMLKSEKTERKISVRFELAERDDGFVLSAVDEDGVTAQYALVCEKKPAEKPEQAKEVILKQIKKLGATMFSCDKVNIVWSNSYFLPVGILNDMRRTVLALLEVERGKKVMAERRAFVTNDVPYPERSLTFLANVANKKAEQFYRRHGVREIEPALELQDDSSGKQLMIMKHCLRFQFGLCCKSDGDAAPLFLNDAKRRYRLEFDCARCEMKLFLDEG
jgi:putative protease